MDISRMLVAEGEHVYARIPGRPPNFRRNDMTDVPRLDADASRAATGVPARSVSLGVSTRDVAMVVLVSNLPAFAKVRGRSADGLAAVSDMGSQLGP